MGGMWESTMLAGFEERFHVSLVAPTRTLFLLLTVFAGGVRSKPVPLPRVAWESCKADFPCSIAVDEHQG